MVARWSMILVLAAGLSGAVAVAGEGRGGPHGAHDPGVMAAHIAAELGLDDATRAKVEGILDAAAAKGKGIGSDLREAGDALKAEHDSASPDLKKMEKLIRKMADLRADIAVLRLHAEADVDALLTPAQRTELRVLREQHRGRGPMDERDDDAAE